MKKILIAYGLYVGLLVALAGFYTFNRVSLAYATQTSLASLAAELPVILPLIKAGDREAASRCVALLDSILPGLDSLRANDAERLKPELQAIRTGCKRFAESGVMVQPES